MSLDIVLGSALPFTLYDPIKNILKFSPDATKVGQYKIKIMLEDNNSEQPLKASESLVVHVRPSSNVASEYEKSINARLKEDYYKVKNMTLTGKLEAKIMKISMDGLVEIKFSSSMLVI